MGVEVFIPLGGIAMVAFVVWTLARAGTARSEHRLQAHSRMLDRFGSSAEFVSFLQTPEGHDYLKTVSLGAKKSQKEKIVGGVRAGVVLIFLSVALMAVSFMMGFSRPMQEPPFVFGFLGLFLGLGFLASAAVSFRLTQAWKLDEAEPR